MKKIGLITNKERDKDLFFTRSATEAILEAGAQAYHFCLPSADYHGVFPTEKEEEIINDSDFIITLGGDGTFLKAARLTIAKNKPLLGINLGSLGFLTEIDRHEIKSSINSLIQDEYTLEERMLLSTSIFRNGNLIAKDTAINDIVISRGALSRIIHVKTYINNVFVDTFPGDGLIISSPTGSTGYSLSAGGPIVEPDINLMILTPICPHILYSRSFITAGDREVRTVIEESHTHNAMVTVDGQKGYEISGGDYIVTIRSPHVIRLVRLKPVNYYRVLRNKIYNRGENLNKDEI